MKKFIYMVLTIFFIIITLEMYYSNTSLENLLLKWKDNFEIEEIAYKLTYKTENDIKNEQNRILNLLSKKYPGNISCKENNVIEVENSTSKIHIVLWEENNTVLVDSTMLINTKNVKDYEIQNQLEFMVNNKCDNIRYFENVMGKLKVKIDNKTQKTLLNQDLEEITGIEIDNGNVYTAKLNDETKISVAYIDYNTGSHIVIGTPRIFVTY